MDGDGFNAVRLFRVISEDSAERDSPDESSAFLIEGAQWKHKDHGESARRLPRKPRRSVSCSFLQFSSLLGPTVPRVYLLGSLWIFYQRKARRVYSQKPSNRIGYSGVFCDILILFDGYCWKSDEDLTKGLRNDRVREILQKNSKSLPFPYFNFSFFFLSKD